jgi:hypothetical protein
MDQKTILSISAQVYRQFPEVAGTKPKVRKQQLSGSSTGSKPSQNYLLTYHAGDHSSQGRTFQRWIRVTSDAQGRILKISTSH